MYRRSSGWTGFAITCFPCTAMTPQKSSMRLSKSYCLMWVTPRWYVAGRATSTSGCPCWTSRHRLSPRQVQDVHLKHPQLAPLMGLFPHGVGGWVTALLPLACSDLALA